MTKIKRVAHFAGTLNGDGVTRVILSLIKEAKKMDIDSVIVTGFAKDGLISPEKIILVPSISFPLYKEYKLPRIGINGFEEKLNEFKPDVIHVHSPDTIAWAAKQYARKYKIPIIATYHTNFNRYLTYYHLSFLKFAVWFMLKSIYRRMDFVTTPSETVSEELRERKITHLETIYWGVDLNKFNPSFRSLEWRSKILRKGEKTILLCVGRLTKEKDFKTLAETYKLLKEKRNDFAMVLAGDGPLREELEKLMPDAIFLGHVSGNELSEIYASSDILFFPSSTEVFANVTLEALSSGIFPVLADVGGMSVLIKKNKKIGLLCKPHNAKDFCQKINTLLDNPELLKEGQLSGIEFIKNFTWERVFENMLKVYSKES